MDLDEVALDPPRAQRVLERGLNLEDQRGFGAAQIEEPPVESLIEARVVGDRRLGNGLAHDLERGDLDLDAAQLDALVVLELTRHADHRAVGERAECLGEFGSGELLGRRLVVEVAGCRVHELQCARLVAQNDELHLLLIAHGLDPSGHRHGAVGQGRELRYHGASHEAKVYRRHRRARGRGRSRRGQSGRTLD